MQKIYSRINWENFPSEKTAVNESNLNKMDLAIDNLDDRVVAMDASKVDLTKANELVKEILWDESNGTLTVVKMNGSQAVIDTKLEKLAVNFTYNPQTQQLVITLDDGTVQNVDLSSLITEYEFLDSDTIAFEIVDGKVKAIVKNGSITEDHLSPDYLGEIRTQVGRAESSATSADASEKNAASSSTLAKSYAVGGTGTREGEDSDNARYYMEQAKAVSAVDIATTEKAGIVKPDGTTITADEDGTLHGVAKVTVDTAMSSTSTNPVQNKVVKSYVDNGVNSSKKLQTYKAGSTTETYGDAYTLYAQWIENNHLKIKCDNYTVETDYANDAARVNGHTVNADVPSGAKFTDTTYGVATTTKTGIVKPDGTTITVDEDGTLHGVAKITVDTALSSTSTNPVQNKVVNAAIKKKADTILYDKSANTLYLKSGSTVLSSTEIKSGGGGATITPKPTVNPQIKNDDKKVVITWEDPTNTVIEGSTFSTWAGTKLVMKESGYPTSPDDGTVLVDNTTRNKYKTTGFTKSGLTNDKVYYFALFPYSTDGVYNYDSGNRLLGEPTGLKIVTFASGTDAEIAKMIQAHYNNKINIADYWAVGDTRSVSLSAMSATGVGESHRAQTVQFVIGDFEHDDLTTPINGHSKAAVTLLQKDCLMDASNASNPVNGGGNTENGYMNSTNTNVGGWKNCARRTWCNNVFFAALPSVWQSMVKTVNKKVSVGNNQSTIETVQDKVFLAAEIEIFGSITYSFAGEGAQYQYYKNATANRYKMPKYNTSSYSSYYCERSPWRNSDSHFCSVYAEGDAGILTANSANGISPCLCI